MKGKMGVNKIQKSSRACLKKEVRLKEEDVQIFTFSTLKSYLHSWRSIFCFSLEWGWGFIHYWDNPVFVKKLFEYVWLSLYSVDMWGGLIQATEAGSLQTHHPR